MKDKNGIVMKAGDRVLHDYMGFCRIVTICDDGYVLNPEDYSPIEFFDDENEVEVVDQESNPVKSNEQKLREALQMIVDKMSPNYCFTGISGRSVTISCKDYQLLLSVLEETKQS